MSRTAHDLAPPPDQAALDEARTHTDFHPIEVVPGFRGTRRGPWRDLYLTLVWNTFIGIAFTGVAWLMNARYPSVTTLWVNVAISNFAGFTIHGLFMVGSILGIDLRIYRISRAAFGLYTGIVATLGVLGGFLIGGTVLGINLPRYFASGRWMMIVGLSSLFITIILMSIFFWRARTADADANLERARQREERAQREAALANLRALQAQIEPHFLFNTLANVTSLIDPDPAKAKRMLESFNRFLRASLAATRERTTTLRAERELIAAFLDVLQVRMGDRLRYAIDIDPSLLDLEIPPMLLQPIVENAIRHGLEPKLEGGEVRFTAAREAGHAVIAIADTGVGFGATTSGGLGLTNVRDRLRLLYGERASLSIGENAPAGTRIAVRIPA